MNMSAGQGMYIIDLQKILTYREILDYAITLKRRYEPFVRLESIGKSVEGKEMFGLSLGFGKKYLICIAGIHGRETINPAVFLEIAEDYCKAFWGENIYYGLPLKHILKEYSIFFIPLGNPDGYMSAIESNPFEKCNRNHIDLNRNFKSRFFVPNRYMLFANSEPEVKAITKVFCTLPSIGLLDFHSRGRGIYYYRKAMSKEYNIRQYQIGKKLAEISGYVLYPPEEEFGDMAGGNTVHYYSEYIRQPAFTIETVSETARFPLHYCWIKKTYEEIRRLPIEYLAFLSDDKKKI